ncbi:MAG: DUF6160 family protein [Pseudomonadota bacterium]
MRRLATLALAMPLFASAMEPLSDKALAKVAGRDGMSFNLNNFAMSGTMELRYTNAQNTASFSIGNLAASRSDNTDAPFADPYTLDVVSGGAGRADIITLARPQNASGKEVWQIAYDLGVNANGQTVTTNMVMKDLAYYGGGMQWTTPRNGDGMAFGYALRSDLGSLAIQPNGRGDTSGAMTISGVRIAAADSNSPWRIADVSTQPGIFNARTDVVGNSSLHIGIEWPDAVGAAAGSIAIDNISFNSTAGQVNLGASRIGSIQIQYLDIKFH